MEQGPPSRGPAAPQPPSRRGPPGPDPRRIPGPRPIHPLKPRGSWFWRVFLLCLLGVAIYGGYRGHARYKVYEDKARFSRKAADLRQALLHQHIPVRPGDVRPAVVELAREAGVTVEPGTLQVTLKPLTDGNRHLLPAGARTALSLVGRMENPRRRQDEERDRPKRWLAGFEGRFTARHGPARETFAASRYTYLKDAEVAAR